MASILDIARDYPELRFTTDRARRACVKMRRAVCERRWLEAQVHALEAMAETRRVYELIEEIL